MRVLGDWRALRVPRWIVKEKYAYEKLPKEPLVVRAELGTPYVPAETNGAVHLDSVLSAAALGVLPYPPPPNDGTCPLPLPLELAWVSTRRIRFVEHRRDDNSEIAQEGGLPLWVCSDLRPQGDLVRDQEYWHKRYPSDRADLSMRLRANQKAGRWKEYRMPLATLWAPELRAVCVGHRETVVALLSGISHVGKKPSQGFGRVLRWSVEPLDAPLDDAREAAMMGRAVPVEYLASLGETSLSGVSRGGWTPPYWYAPWHGLVSVRA